MIVVLCREEQVIYQPHRDLQSRMQKRMLKQTRVGTIKPIHERGSSPPKIRQNRLDRPLVILPLKRAAVRQICHGQRIVYGSEILHARHP